MLNMTTASYTNIIFFCYPNKEINVQSKQQKHYNKLWSLFTITKLDNRVTLPSRSNMLLHNFGETLWICCWNMNSDKRTAVLNIVFWTNSKNLWTKSKKLISNKRISTNITANNFAGRIFGETNFCRIFFFFFSYDPNHEI